MTYKRAFYSVLLLLHRSNTAAFRSKQLLADSTALKALAKNTLHISRLSKSKHPLHLYVNGSWRHHTDLIGLHRRSHYTDTTGKMIHSQLTKALTMTGIHHI